MPGLIPDSHKNKGLGIQFLRHVERCTALLYIIDVSEGEPWTYFSVLQQELHKFNPGLSKRPSLIIANKIDLLDNSENIELLKQHTQIQVVPVSAKKGTNLKELLFEMRKLYDQNKEEINY